MFCYALKQDSFVHRWLLHSDCLLARTFRYVVSLTQRRYMLNPIPDLLEPRFSSSLFFSFALLFDIFYVGSSSRYLTVRSLTLRHLLPVFIMLIPVSATTCRSSRMLYNKYIKGPMSTNKINQLRLLLDGVDHWLPCANFCWDILCFYFTLARSSLSYIVMAWYQTN